MNVLERGTPLIFVVIPINTELGDWLWNHSFIHQHWGGSFI